jgi:hypothetical protein
VGCSAETRRIDVRARAPPSGRGARECRPIAAADAVNPARAGPTRPAGRIRGSFERCSRSARTWCARAPARPVGSLTRAGRRRYHPAMQHGVDAIRGRRHRSRFVLPAAHPSDTGLGIGRVFHTVPGPAPAIAEAERRHPVVAVRAAAGRLGHVATPGATPKRGRVARTGIRWAPARRVLRDGGRRRLPSWPG